MIRLANELDLSAVATIYEAILDHEDATGIHYPGWQRGAYPTADTARSIFDAGTLYVGVDETGSVWGSMNLNGQQLPEYQNGAGKTVLRLDTGTENLPANRMYPALSYKAAGSVDTFFMGDSQRPLNLYEKKL